MQPRFFSDDEQKRIQCFVDVFLERCTDIAVSVPDEMKNGLPDKEGWIPWKAVDSPVQVKDVLEIERVLGEPFPPLFRAYLTCKCLLMTEFFGVVLPETPFDRPLEPLKKTLYGVKISCIYESNRTPSPLHNRRTRSSLP